VVQAITALATRAWHYACSVWATRRKAWFPELSRAELFRYFTLTQADLAFVDPGRGPADRLGLAIALCTLPWLGFVPDAVAAAPPVAVARLAEQLQIDAAQAIDAELAQFGLTGYRPLRVRDTLF
jgi:hypothetical protein